MAIQDFWPGGNPTAPAFLRQLDRPFQVAVLATHQEFNHITFPLSEAVLAGRYELVRRERTTESLCTALGVDPARILAAIEAASPPSTSAEDASEPVTWDLDPNPFWPCNSHSACGLRTSGVNECLAGKPTTGAVALAHRSDHPNRKRWVQYRGS